MKTTVTTEIQGERVIAKTPHNPALTGEGDSESEAINSLVAVIRGHGDKPLAWDAEAKAPQSKDAIVRHLGGCWPQTTKPMKPEKPAKRKDTSDGN